MSDEIQVGATFHKKRRVGTYSAMVEGPPPTAPERSKGRLPRIARYMALAIYYEDLIRQGHVHDHPEIATLGHVTRARVTQIMNLRILAPDIQQQLLEMPQSQTGRDSPSLRQLQTISHEQDWKMQRQIFDAHCKNSKKAHANSGNEGSLGGLTCPKKRYDKDLAIKCVPFGLTQMTGVLSMPSNNFQQTRRQFIGSATASTVVLALGCRPNSTESLPRTKIKAGYVKVLAALPFMYAASNGLFAKRNLDVELVEFASSNEVSTAAVAGQIDFIGAGATNACLDAMAASGKVLQISTSNDYVRRPDLQSTDFLIAQKQFQSVADLKGQTVAFFPGSFGRVFARLVLPKIGLSIEDVKYVEMAPAQWLASLKSGAIQAVTAMEPIATNIMLTMDVSVLVDGYYGLAMQNVPGSGTWFRSGHLQPRVERLLQEGMVESIDLITKNPKVASKAIEELFGLQSSVAEKVRLLSWNDATSQRGRENLMDFAALLDKEGAIQKPAPASGEWIWSNP